jgi:hypothetical protein
MRPIAIALGFAALNVFGAEETHQTTYWLRGKVVDAQTQSLIASRIYIQGRDGAWHFAKSESSSGSAIEYRKQKEWNSASVEMHTTLSAHPFGAHLPSGAYTVLVERGKECLLRPRRAEIEFLTKRMEDELARHAEVLPAASAAGSAALDEYKEALRIYQEIARTAR